MYYSIVSEVTSQTSFGQSKRKALVRIALSQTYLGLDYSFIIFEDGS